MVHTHTHIQFSFYLFIDLCAMHECVDMAVVVVVALSFWADCFSVFALKKHPPSKFPSLFLFFSHSLCEYRRLRDAHQLLKHTKQRENENRMRMRMRCEWLRLISTLTLSVYILDFFSIRCYILYRTKATVEEVPVAMTMANTISKSLAIRFLFESKQTNKRTNT